MAWTHLHTATYPTTTTPGSLCGNCEYEVSAQGLLLEQQGIASTSGKSTITTGGIQGLVVTRSFNSLEAAESWKTYVSGMFAAVEGQYVITAI